MHPQSIGERAGDYEAWSEKRMERIADRIRCFLRMRLSLQHSERDTESSGMERGKCYERISLEIRRKEWMPQAFKPAVKHLLIVYPSTEED